MARQPSERGRGRRRRRVMHLSELGELSKRAGAAAAVSLFSFHNTCWEGGRATELLRGVDVTKGDGEIVEVSGASLRGREFQVRVTQPSSIFRGASRPPPRRERDGAARRLFSLKERRDPFETLFIERHCRQAQKTEPKPALPFRSAPTNVAPLRASSPLSSLIGQHVTPPN